jgi:fatty-acid desaturase
MWRRKLNKINFKAYLHFVAGAFGIGPVSHNYYSHKSYKASVYLQNVMVIAQSMSGCVKWRSKWKLRKN